MAHTQFRTALIAIVFLGMISFPILNDHLQIIQDIPSSENRAMSKKPVMDIQALDPFPAQYEKYYNDTFALRNQLVDFYSQIQFKFFKVSPIPEVAMLGKEDWFFFAGNEQDSYLGTHRFTPEELDSFKLELEYRQEYLHRLGAEMYFMVAPVKNNIYTEYQPTTAYPLYPDCNGEQLLAFLQANTTVKTINVYDILRAKRHENLAYYKRDNHWTPFGAFHAANVILSRFHEDFPMVAPNREEDFEFKKTDITVGNVADMFGLKNLIIDTTVVYVPKQGCKAYDVPKVPYPAPDYFAYPWDYEISKETADTTKPKLLIISDSFGSILQPFLAEHFHRCVKIFDSWEYALHPDIVENERPDAVLWMPLEGFLRHVLQHQSRLGIK